MGVFYVIVIALEIILANYGNRLIISNAITIKGRPQRTSADFPLFLTPTPLMSATVCLKRTSANHKFLPKKDVCKSQIWPPPLHFHVCNMDLFQLNFAWSLTIYCGILLVFLLLIYFMNFCPVSAKRLHYGGGFFFKCRRLHSWDPSPPRVGKCLQLGTPYPPKNCGRPLWTAPNIKNLSCN